MRFLINSSSTNIASKVTKATKVASDPKIPSTARTWGQHCSPNCGCVVRFETHLDPGNNNQILSASYDAKTIVTKVIASEDGSSTFLKPVRTEKGRPLLKECTCPTVHKLSKAMTEILPGHTLSQAQNQVEFMGIRSSPAFRYTVLKNHGLLSETSAYVGKGAYAKVNHIPEGLCFDLVEEALTACLHGYLPKPRKGTTQHYNPPTFNRPGDVHRTKPDIYAEKKNTSNEDNDNNSTGLDPLRFVNAAKNRAKTSTSFFESLDQSSSSTSTSPSSMPPFHMMADQDDTSSNGEGIDTLAQLKLEMKIMDEKERKLNDERRDLTVHDWVSYVDDKHSDTNES